MLKRIVRCVKYIKKMSEPQRQILNDRRRNSLVKFRASNFLKSGIFRGIVRGYREYWLKDGCRLHTATRVPSIVPWNLTRHEIRSLHVGRPSSPHRRRGALLRRRTVLVARPLRVSSYPPFARHPPSGISFNGGRGRQYIILSRRHRFTVYA